MLPTDCSPALACPMRGHGDWWGCEAAGSQSQAAGVPPHSPCARSKSPPPPPTFCPPAASSMSTQVLCVSPAGQVGEARAGGGWGWWRAWACGRCGTGALCRYEAVCLPVLSPFLFASPLCFFCGTWKFVFAFSKVASWKLYFVNFMLEIHVANMVGACLFGSYSSTSERSMASESRESSHATSPLLGLACMGHSCLQRAGSGWACRVSERLLPNANVGGGVAESGGWCPPPHIRRAHAARAPLCPPTARSMSVDSAALRGPGVRKGAAHAGGAGWRGPGHMGVRAVGAPVLSRREGPLGVGVAFFLRANLPRAVAHGRCGPRCEGGRRGGGGTLRS
jgi:hypothetical protein